MINRAIIHIGTEKTGTTTIQEFLHVNHALLADQGIAYPQSIGVQNHEKLVVYCMEHDRTNVYIQRNNIESRNKRKKWKARLITEFDKELRRI